MALQTYPLSMAAPFDYSAAGQLGPIQHVSGARMLRHLTVDGFYYGAIYGAIASDRPLSEDLHRVPGRDSVAFTLAPYEHSHRNRDFTSWGPHGGVAVPRYGCRLDGSGYEHTDYTLWNTAAAALSVASLDLTFRFNRFELVQFEQGRWRCSYVGTDGVDTVWHQCRTLSAGILRVRSGGRPHFLAVDAAGARYRLCVFWRRESEPFGDVVQDVAAIHLGGPTADIPGYLRRWVLSRCHG